jgi:hypothetical protein
MKKISLICLFILFFSSVAFFSLTLFSIYGGVKEACVQAKQKFKEDCVNSLISFAKSEKYSLRERNSAIWALGQLADKRALPLLYELNQSLPSQEQCQHDQFLCKYEIEKAIKWCEHGNITHWMYWNQENW